MDRIRNNDEAVLMNTYNMAEDPATDSIVSWSQSGKSFIIWNPVEFTGNYRYLKWLPHILSLYDFRRVGPEINNEYANDNFVRGQPELMKNIRRPGFFMSIEDIVDQIKILTMEKEELLAELRKQDLQIKELKHRLQHNGICRL